MTVSLVRKSPLGELTYRVPEGLWEEVVPGIRVEVPLARAKAVGYVIREASAPEQEVRDIADVLDAEPLLLPEQLRLAEFAAGYYLSPLAEALRLTHPAGLDMVEHRQVSITPEGQLALSRADLLLAVQGLELTGMERSVLEDVTAHPRDAQAVLKRTRSARHRDLIRLARRGLVALAAASYEPKVAQVFEKLIALAPDPPPEVDLEALRRRAPRQASILDALREAGGPVALSRLRKEDPAIHSRLAPLVQKGWIVIETQERRRDPMAGVAIKPHPPPTLNLDQAHALSILSAARREGGFHPFLLHGVTSSGKTEVYLRLIREGLDDGQGAIVLVPEISLTPQLAGRFRARFPEGVAVLHSALSDGQRQDEWRRVRRGEVQLVVGARSALFAPVKNLGILVVDEEHDTSFKQEEGLRYNARDLALVRGQQAGAVVVLGSATPALESTHNARQERFRLLSLPKRATPQPLPQVEIIDLKKYRLDPTGVLTAPLAEALGDTLDARQQTIIFLNRRGFAPFVLCLTCGAPRTCPHCSVSLTLHKRRRQLVCHYCAFATRPLKICPACGAENLRAMGLGTERVAEALHERFPGARIGRLDRDTARGNKLQEILEATANGHIDVLVGTQMVTKGHDFPGVTLVGVINADHALHLPDFRASERTFQLLSQVAGRAGRGGAPGRVIIQTYNPEHHAIAFAKTHDYQGFFAAEMRFRKELGYPPTGHLVALRIEGPDESQVIAAATALGKMCAAASQSVSVLGPAEAPIGRIRGRARWQILLKGDQRKQVHGVAKAAQIYKQTDKPAGVRVLIDVDPQSML